MPVNDHEPQLEFEGSVGKGKRKYLRGDSTSGFDFVSSVHVWLKEHNSDDKTKQTPLPEDEAPDKVSTGFPTEFGENHELDYDLNIDRDGELPPIKRFEAFRNTIQSIAETNKYKNVVFKADFFPVSTFHGQSVFKTIDETNLQYIYAMINHNDAVIYILEADNDNLIDQKQVSTLIFSPNEAPEDTLKEILQDFSDNRLKWRKEEIMDKATVRFSHHPRHLRSSEKEYVSAWENVLCKNIDHVEYNINLEKNS
jgi:hypothetical protein